MNNPNLLRATLEDFLQQAGMPCKEAVEDNWLCIISAIPILEYSLPMRLYCCTNEDFILRVCLGKADQIENKLLLLINQLNVDAVRLRAYVNGKGRVYMEYWVDNLHTERAATTLKRALYEIQAEPLAPILAELLPMLSHE